MPRLCDGCKRHTQLYDPTTVTACLNFFLLNAVRAAMLMNTTQRHARTLEPVVSWYPHSAVPRECGPLWFVSHTLVVLCGLAPLVSSCALHSSHLVITRYLGHRLQRLERSAGKRSCMQRKAKVMYEHSIDPRPLHEKMPGGGGMRDATLWDMYASVIAS
jgi:hypothetical protein